GIGAGIGFTFAARADDVARAVRSLQRNEPPRCTRFFWLGSEDQSASEPFDSWVRPRLQFADVLDRIGAFPVSERTRKELLVGALSPRWAGVHQLLISRSRILLVLYQSEVLSLPHRSKRIGLPLLHIDGRVPRMRVLTIWRNHRGDDVLAGRQIAIVILTFAQVRHFGTIDRNRKREIRPEVCNPVNDNVAATLLSRKDKTRPQLNQTSAGQLDKV